MRSVATLSVSAAFMALAPSLYAPVEPDCGGDHVDFPCETCPCPEGENGPDDDGPNGIGCNSCTSSGVAGMPVWRVSEPYMNVWIHDEPLGYQPSHGPRVSFMLAYKQRSANIGADLATYNMGPQWYFSWQSILTPGDGTSSGPDLVHLAGGGSRFMTNGVRDYYSLGRVSRVDDPATSFEMDYPDGRTNVYGLITTNLFGAVQAFVTEQRNAQGQAIQLQYEPFDPAVGVVRLRHVVDADNRTNTIYYSETHPYNTNLIYQVVDPFGRTTTMLYDENDLLTNIVDVAGLSTSFTYDENQWITNMVTPYGTTSFKLTGTGYGFSGRSVEITEANGSKQLYYTKDNATDVPSSYASTPATTPFGNTFDNSTLDVRNSFYWNRQQYQALSYPDINYLTGTDFKIGRMRHWLKGNWDTYGRTLSLQREPSPDGTVDGQITWYDYAGKPASDHESTQILPLFVARVLPDGTSWYQRTARNDRGWVTNQVSTYTKTDGTVGTRTNTLTYAANNIDMALEIGPNNEQVVSNYFGNAYHQPDARYDALNQETRYTYNGNRQLTSLKSPGGLTTTNVYFPSGADVNRLDKSIDLEIKRTNAYTYANGLMYSHTDERGLTVTNYWDNLQRLIAMQYPDGTTVSNFYTALDLTATKDRLGYWTSAGFNSIRQKIAETNANIIIRSTIIMTKGPSPMRTTAMRTFTTAVAPSGRLSWTYQMNDVNATSRFNNGTGDPFVGPGA